MGESTASSPVNRLLSESVAFGSSGMPASTFSMFSFVVIRPDS